MRSIRTGFSRAIGAIILLCMVVIGMAVINGGAYAQPVGHASAPRRGAVPIKPKDAFDSLEIGNRRFYTGNVLPRKYPQDIFRADTGHPFAAILCCMDSRTPNDLTFDRGLGETFGIRVAGNIVNPDVIGSLEYAAKVKGVVLIAVIGHTDCGAIKGAIMNVQLGSLTQLLRKIVPAINSVPSRIQPRDTSNHAFVQMVADSNVIQMMRQIRSQSPILNDLITQGTVMLVGGMYDVKTGRVVFFKP